jgi:hypothetical protein
MDKCKEITFCVKELLKTHRIYINDEKDRSGVIVLLSNYIDLLIFNIVAVISIICANIGVRRVISQHIEYLSKYIDKRCVNSAKPAKTAKTAKARMSGGAFNTAAFYGVSEPRYSAANEGVATQTIDFAGGIARNALLMTGGAGGVRRHVTPNCVKLDKIILKKIRNVFKFFNIKAEREATMHIKAKYDMIIEDLLTRIKKIKGGVTSGRVAVLIKKSKIMKKK